MKIAVIGSSGGMKGIFVQGVFHAFERAGFYADAYAGTSASALPAISAAGKLCEFVGIDYWQHVLELLHTPGLDLSQVMRQVTREWEAPDEPFIRELFKPEHARLFIPVNYVHTDAAAEQTQSEACRRLGRKLLIAAARKERTWVDTHLRLHLFDTRARPDDPRTLKLHGSNLADVAFASARMIQWTEPAEIDGRPYVDASYTCASPVYEMIAHGYERVIVISTETGPLYRDIFADHEIPAEVKGVPVDVIRPAVELKTMGVDFAGCTASGLRDAYAHGQEQGQQFMARS